MIALLGVMILMLVLFTIVGALSDDAFFGFGAGIVINIVILAIYMICAQ